MILIVGNWKMAPEKSSQAIDLAKKINTIAKANKKRLSIVVCPPYVYISTIAKQLKNLTLGAQSVAESIEIAQTGSVSAGMLKDYGVSYCIVGHSESRAKGQTNELVQEQVIRLLDKKIKPILCVGEKERDSHGWYLSVIKDQIESALQSVPKATVKNITIAYEPVWAIGKDALREATPEECCEMIIYIRKIIADIYGDKVASSVTVIYGGSVDETNAVDFINSGMAQGFLVGRVSLDAKRFAKLADNITSHIK